MASLRLSGAWLRKATPRAKAAMCDLTGFAGAGTIAYGAWLVYPPAGFLVGGSLLVAFALYAGRRLDAGPA